MKSPTITSLNYLIRPFKISDAKLWQQWDIDPEVQAFMPELLNKSQDIKEQYRYIEESQTDEEGYYWSIETQQGITVGTVALTEYNNHHKIANLGIMIGDKNYWGKGASTEVVTTVVNYAFTHLNIFYIGAEVEEGNISMMKVLEKIGFKQDGLFEHARVKNGKRIDVYHFSLAKQHSYIKNSKIIPIKQRDDSACGPTSIEMTLKYFNIPHTVADITKTTNYKKEGGIYNNQLVSTLQNYGLKTEVFKNTSWEQLIKLNTKDSVIILSWMLDGYIGHLSVLDNVDNIYIYIAEPTTGKILKIEKIKFLRLWLDYEIKDDVPMYPESTSDIQLRWMCVVSKS